jgi:hypothetical protein
MIFRQLALIYCVLFTLFIPVHGNTSADTSKFNDPLKKAEYIHALWDSIEQSGRYVEKLDTSTFFNIPIAFTGGADKDPSYAIIISKVTIKPGTAYFTANMSLTNPLDGKRLAFEAQNIPFSFKGGLAGDIRLALVTECKINLCKDVDLLFMPGSYVEWGCDGFKRLRVKGRVEFASSTFLPANYDGTLKNDGSKLSVQVDTEISNLNDFALSLTLDPFQIKGVPLTFACKDLVIDYSDYTNPETVKFPQNYSGLPLNSPNLWRGIYIGEATVILGPEFRKKSSKAPTSFSAKDFIIDRNGLSGTLAANNILALDDGDLGGWKFSVSGFSVTLVTSKITEAEFNGEVHIPMMKEGQNLTYSALIDMEGRYSFTVSPSDTLSFPVFGNSKLELYKNSSVTIEVEDGKFIPTALLTGSISINAPFSKENSKNNLELAHVEFQEMRISTIEPVFDVKYLAVSGLSQGAFAAFPISIDKIAIRTTGTEARLSIGLVLNLMDSNKEGFGGKTTITMVSERDGFKFHYKGLEIERIQVDVVKPGAFELHGGIAFAKDDPDYGNGFRGDIDAKFGDKIQVTAIALFGKVNGLRYFFVDALLAIKPGIQAGPLTFYGFGGGLYYHMKQQTGVVDKNSFGASRSGIVYKPNDQISIGIMAEVKFGVASEQLIDADTKFEIVFNSSGGLNRIGFEGNAKCIVPNVDIVPDQIKEAAQKLSGGGKLDFSPTSAALAVSIIMNMDFENDVFHAELEAFVNVGPILRGVGDQGSAGKCVMHIEPSKWYLHIGSPSNPLGLRFLGFIQATSYFMVGHDIPTKLPLHPTVASILKISPEQASSNRKEDDLEAGKGIAFGSSFSINTGDLTFLCFYGKFEVGAGFDIMLISYGKDCYCAGHSAPLGINGWYAKGQAYAYLDGQIGIKVKVFHKEKKFEILSIGAAALLRAEGPNPLYLEGQAGGRFSVLGGMVKGECKFKVTYGEKCEIVKPGRVSPVQDLEMIATLTPSDKQTDVDLFVIPQAVFNVPVNKVMNISDDNGIAHRFRANLEKCELKQGGLTIAGNKQWNADNTVLALNFDEILDPNTEYSFETELSFEEWKNGKWETVTDSGKKITERKVYSFTTGALPKSIPADRIAYSYPVMRQYNFYPQEYPEGYIAFNIGLKAFFNPVVGWKQQARFVPVGGGKSVLSDIKYDASTKTLSFGIPTSLTLDKVFRLELVNIPTTNDIGRNVSDKLTQTDLEDDSNSMEVRTREAQGTISRAEEIVFFNYGFRTSKFKTMNDKLSMTEMNVNMLYEVSPYVYHLQTTFYGTEMFDKFENYGTDKIQPLIKRTAILENTPWYKEAVEPIIYKDYPLLGLAYIEWRNTQTWGVPPTGEVKIWQLNYDHVLTDEEFESGVATTVTSWAHFMYSLPWYWSKDYYDIRMKLANQFPNNSSTDAHVQSILGKVIWPVVDKGDYPVKFEYVLPGINKVTSSKTFIVKNPYDIVQPTL